MVVPNMAISPGKGGFIILKYLKWLKVRVRFKDGNFEVQCYMQEEFCQDSEDLLQGDTRLCQSFTSTLRFYYNDSSCLSQISEGRN